MAFNRIHRIIRLITLLESGEFKHSHELTEELDISRRTLFRDLKMLQLAGIPYYHDPKQGYRIAASFFLPPVNLTVPEALALLLLGRNVSVLKGKPLGSATLSAIWKMTSMIPDPIRMACSELLANISVQPGARAIGENEEDNFVILQQAIEGRYVCEVQYQTPLGDEPMQLDIEPYALHFASRSWYVFANSSAHGEVRTFKLSRFDQITHTKKRFGKPDFSADEKLGKAWQIIPEGKVYRVELEFAKRVATNVTEVRWHPTQNHSILPDGRCRMSFEIDGLNEISWWLCGYAGQVRVLKPKALANRVKQMHQDAIEQYA